MQKITSRDNSKLKLLRKARESRADGLVFVEGLRLAEELLRSDSGLADIFVSETMFGSGRAEEILNVCGVRGVSVAVVRDKLFDSLADTKSSQGIIMLGTRPESSFKSFERRLEARKAMFPLVILLHGINNPSNLGAILRTAEATGVDGVIITRNSADVFSPKALRASMGAAFRLNVWSEADFGNVVSWGRENGFRSVAADIGAAKSYDAVDWNQPKLLVFGSEAHGLRADEFAKIDEGLIIPMQNNVESLNLAVAAGIVLFEAVRQRR